MFALFLSTFGNGNLSSARAQAWTSTHQITYFQGNKAGAVSFSFDDGYPSQATTAVSELNARGLKGTFFIIIDWVEVPWGGWPTWATWQNVAAQGHEIASHTVTHPDLTTLSGDEVRWELSTSQFDVNQNIPGKDCISLSYPFTDSDSTVQAIAADYYVAARGGWADEGGFINYYQPGVSPMGPFSAVNFNNVGSMPMDGITISDPDFNSRLDRAALYHGWFTLMFHGIPDATAFGNTINYIQGKHDYWIDTFGNISRYMKERLNSTIQVVTDTPSEIRLQIIMSPSLPTSIYNVPLTLRSTVPASWTQVIVQQGSTIQTLTPVIEGSDTVVYYNALPNGGDVILTLPNPVPGLTSLNPASAFAGGSSFTLTVTGANFVNGSIVRWNNSDRTTTYVSNTQLTASIPAADIASVGTANIRVFNPTPGGGASNELPFAITAEPITVTVIPGQFKTYGDDDPVFTYTSSDPAATFTGALSRVSGENVGAYAINQDTLAVVGSNYVITSFVSANFTITKVIVAPSITADNKIYNGTTVATIATRSLTGMIGADVVNLSGGTAAFADKNVGTGKSVTATGLTLSGADAGNYQLSTTSATTTANIGSRTLTVTATGVNKIYDGTTTATITLSDDRLGGDNVTTNYTTASFLDPNVGPGKTVNVSGISITGGTDVGNYTLGNTTATTTANITIDEQTQTIIVTTPAPATASGGTNFNVAATASSGLPVAITTSGVCTGSGSDTADITMTSDSGICSVFYNQAGNANYNPAIQIKEDVTAIQRPGITSADNTTFSLGSPSAFTVTTTGNPATPMTITENGVLPTGVTFIDNTDGTATLSGIPTTAGIYPLTFTADNGVLPNATQSFTLTVKNGPVIGANGIKSVPGTSNGSIIENEVIFDTLGITQITVEFSQDANNPALDTDPKDVTNPANYMLVLGSSAGVFQTVSCSGGIVAPDVSITINSVTYDNGGGSGPFVATLKINSGFPLNATGFYRLYVCGTTSIADAANVNLKLAGDGVNPGTDFLRNFQIQTRVIGGGGAGNDNNAKKLNTRGLLIPVTGFAPKQVTPLPIQPADKVYKSLGELRIEIPTLGINFPIVGAAINKNGWDLTWLQNNVAYLEGSAYPTLDGNTVLTAHVTEANNNLGPFSDIKGMQLGQKIYIRVNGQVYVYQVQMNSKILPSNISTVFEHKDHSWITLVTCEDYNAKTGLYQYRRIVRAVLISIIPEK